MGLQHAVIIAVSVAGSATLLYSRASLALFAEEYSDDKAAYLISASLIVSGVATVLQALHLRLPFTNIRLGSGVLSTLGTTATFAPIAQAAIRMMADDGAATSWDEAYGKLLGTWMVCALLQMLLSLTPPRVLRRLLPSFVAGVVITLIGLQAVGASFKQWGGGVECADSYRAVLPPPVAADAAFAYNGTNYLPIGALGLIKANSFTVFTRQDAQSVSACLLPSSQEPFLSHRHSVGPIFPALVPMRSLLTGAKPLLLARCTLLSIRHVLPAPLARDLRRHQRRRAAALQRRRLAVRLSRVFRPGPGRPPLPPLPRALRLAVPPQLRRAPRGALWRVRLHHRALPHQRHLHALLV